MAALGCAFRNIRTYMRCDAMRCPCHVVPGSNGLLAAAAHCVYILVKFSFFRLTRRRTTAEVAVREIPVIMRNLMTRGPPALAHARSLFTAKDRWPSRGLNDGSMQRALSRIPVSVSRLSPRGEFDPGSRARTRPVLRRGWKGDTRL